MPSSTATPSDTGSITLQATCAPGLDPGHASDNAYPTPPQQSDPASHPSPGEDQGRTLSHDFRTSPQHPDPGGSATPNPDPKCNPKCNPNPNPNPNDRAARRAISDVQPTTSARADLAHQLQHLTKEEQLEEVMDILRKASVNVGNGVVMAATAWDHLKSVELWRVGYPSLEDFQVAVGWQDEVYAMVEGARGWDKIRARMEYKLQSEWGCDLESLFDPAERPATYSKHFLGSLTTLVSLCSREVGLRKIFEARDIRRDQHRSRGCTTLIPTDVALAVRSVREGLANAQNNPATDRNNHTISGDATFTASHKAKGESQTCACSVDLRARFAEDAWQEGCVPIAEAVAAGQEWTTGDGETVICRRHLRTLAGRGFGLYTNRGSALLIKRARAAVSWAARSSLDQLRRAKPHWFRSQSGPLGLWRWEKHPQDAFVFDAERTFERFAGAGSWSTWLTDGNIIIPDLFKYLCTNEIFRRIESEYDAYKYHTALSIHGKARNGWTRTMFYSLIQQLVRQDPAYYAVMAAARPDQNWRLISYPYYTKDTTVGESTGFKHLDLNVPALLSDGRGANIIQTTLSLDDEDEDGCTILVPGFHRNIREWWARVEARGVTADGLTTNVNQRYLREDEESFGSFVPVPCQRGGVRISRPELIHGSTSVSSRRRRTVFVWHCGIREDHVGLDNEESETWDEVARCHRDMDTPLKSTSGHGFAYGKPLYRFPASTRLGSTSAIGDALVGLRRWDEPCVLAERNILLGPDDDKALAHIRKVRRDLLREYRVAFDIMVEAEKVAFGPKSYFANPEKAKLRAAQDPESDSGSEFASDDDSMGSDSDLGTA